MKKTINAPKISVEIIEQTTIMEETTSSGEDLGFSREEGADFQKNSKKLRTFF